MFTGTSQGSVVHLPASLPRPSRFTRDPAPTMWSEYAMPRKPSWIGDGGARVAPGNHSSCSKVVLVR